MDNMNQNSKLITAPNRTFTRAKRCANCKHFEHGGLSQTRWREHRASRVGDYLKTAPIGRLADMENPNWSPAEMKDARLQQIAMMDQMIARGIAGVCMKGARADSDGGPSGDFCHCDFLCERWDGIDGHSVATRGHDDKLNEELHEIADSKAKPVK